jgi:hypothetical protein
MKNIINVFIFLTAFVLCFTTCDTPTNGNNKTTEEGTLFVYAGTASSLEIANNSRGYTFPDTYSNQSKQVSITIKNTGKGTIKLTGIPYIKLDGATAVFSVSTPPESSTISPGASINFTIKFSPLTATESYVYVLIPNNSKNAPDFSFTVYGKGMRPKPVASVFYSDTEISQNGTINAGDSLLNKTKSIEITIKNTGAEPLTIDTANIAITGTNELVFTKSTNPSGTISVESQTSFFIECRPTEPGENNAILTIPTNDISRNPVIVYLRTFAREARNEARLSGLQFTSGVLNPQFNANTYSYDLKIDVGPTVVNVKPTSMDSNVNTIKVNGVSQASGVQSHDITPASTSTVTILVTAEDETTTATYTVNIKIVKTWEKLYGIAGKRYGVFRAISNGEGGIYAGGCISNNTAALFNFDQNGVLKNTFQFSSNDGTVGPTGIGMAYNDYYSVYWDYNEFVYHITKTTNPAVLPNTKPTSCTFNEHDIKMYPAGIIRDSWYYVAGNARYAATTNATQYTYGIFINRHYDNGEFEKGNCFSINYSGINANTYEVKGMTLLLNGDVLLYGFAETTAGKTIAFASAVNVSAANAGSWNVRWTNIYDIPNKASAFYNHFIDNSSNIILLGASDDGGILVKFPASVTTAAAAKPSGWPKTITGTNAGFFNGLAINDGSGYIFVGGATGPYGEQDIWLVKTDLNATKTWEKYYGGSGMEFANVIIEQTDGFVIAGSTRSPVIAGQTKKGMEDIYILKINKDGTMD